MALESGLAKKDSVVRWLCRPLQTLPAGQRGALTVAMTLLTAGGSALLARTMERPFHIPDAQQYLYMAAGEISEVPQPFASRPLAPLLAREIGRVLHVDVRLGFLLLASVSLLFTLGVVFSLAMRSAAPRWFLLAMAAVPFWPQLLHGMALPDVWYAAVLSCLLLCLAADRPYWAALTMFPLMLSRESTSLTLACLLLVGWRRLRWWGSLLAVGAAAAGAAVVHVLSAGAVGNPEHLPQSVYMLGKVPWNLARTFGIQPWSNLYSSLCNPPLWRVPMPIGPLRAVGFCGLSNTGPVEAFVALATTFGLLPMLFVRVWRRRDPIAPGDLLLRFCLLYGIVSLVIAPMLGTWYLRLFGYAWPLFLVAMPRLFSPRCESGQRTARESVTGLAIGAMLVVQLCLGEMAFVFRMPGLIVWTTVFVIAGLTLLGSPAGALLRRSKGGAEGDENARPAW